MKDITRFIQTELNPRIYAHIPQIFPELHFTKKGAKYVSSYHPDGGEGTGKKEDRSVVTEKQPTKVFDNTRQEATDVITLFMENNRITEVWEAVNKLCSIVGILPPEYTPEAKERYKQMEQRRTALEASHQRQKTALFSPDGSAVLTYLRSRGWTDSEIREAELGYISTDEATTINAQRSVGGFYTLSIPLRSGSTLYGFKFRTIQRETNGQDKYTYLYGTEKKGNLFNLTGIQQTDGAIVVVEGELDALHASVRGVKGVVATGGGKLTEELLTAATERGIKRITLLFDKDERGAKFVRESIDVAHTRGISVLVATYPDGESLNDGTPIHDVDEYLQAHSAGELQQLIDRATSGSRYLLEYIVNEHIRQHGEGNLTDAQEIELRDKVIALANSTPSEIERDIIFSTYAEFFNVGKEQLFTKEALRAVADRQRAEQNALKQVEATKKTLKEATALAEKGDAQAALQMMGEAALELRRIDSRAKYSHLLALPTEESLLQRLQDKQGELPTLYELSNGRDTEQLTLPSGAITFICAPTSHGKSTLLQNLAIQVAQGKGDGAVLYFTFEEEGDAVTLQMVNKYIGTELCRNYSSRQSNNIRALRDYFKTGEPHFIRDEAKSVFSRKKAEFFQKYYTSGKIRIYYEDYDSAELIEAIRSISSQTKVKAVFIDYIQLLSSRAYRKAHLQRTEELKEICKDLKNLSIETQLPIIVAAQLNREANSPLELHSQKIAEAADLERIANKILCLWNTSFVAQKSKDSAKELEALEAKHGFKLGEGGKIYAKLTKNRGGVVGLEAVFNFNGNTGVIEGNYKPEAEQESLPFGATERDESDPF